MIDKIIGDWKDKNLPILNNIYDGIASLPDGYSRLKILQKKYQDENRAYDCESTHYELYPEIYPAEKVTEASIRCMIAYLNLIKVEEFLDKFPEEIALKRREKQEYIIELRRQLLSKFELCECLQIIYDFKVNNIFFERKMVNGCIHTSDLLHMSESDLNDLLDQYDLLIKIKEKQITDYYLRLYDTDLSYDQINDIVKKIS